MENKLKINLQNVDLKPEYWEIIAQINSPN